MFQKSYCETFLNKKLQSILYSNLIWVFLNFQSYDRENVFDVRLDISRTWTFRWNSITLKLLFYFKFKVPFLFTVILIFIYNKNVIYISCSRAQSLDSFIS